MKSIGAPLILLSSMLFIVTILPNYAAAPSKELPGGYEIQYNLIENTDHCFVDCHLRFNFSLNKDYTITDAGKFKSKFVKATGALDLRDWGFRIRQNETYEVDIPEYGACTEYVYYNSSNSTCTEFGYDDWNTTYCEYSYICQTGSHVEERWRWTWKDFNPIGKTVVGGKWYTIELWGKKKPKLGENSIDAIPVILDYELPYDWWNASWSYSKNFTESNGNTYTNRFSNISIDTAALIAADKIQPDCDDLRIVDDSNNEIDRKIIRCGHTDTEVWFNFTNSSTAKAWQLFYGYSEATSPTDENFTHWAYGYDFDQLADRYDITSESEWTKENTIDTYHIGKDDWYSESPSGNQSLIVNDTGGGAASLFYNWGRDITTGIIQYKIKFVSGTSDPYPMAIRDSGANNIILMNLDHSSNDKLFYYYSGGTATICYVNPTSWYTVRVEWNSNNFNISVSNESFSFSETGRPHYQAAVGRQWYIDTGASNIYNIDDIIVMETTEHSDPLFVLGSEEEGPKSPTTPTLQNPINGSILSELPEFNWTESTDPNSDPVYYIIEIHNNSNFTNLQYDEFLDTNETSSVSLDNTKIDTYWWRVLATDNTSNSSWSGENFNFTYAQWEITFNVSSGENGVGLDNVDIISCSYSGFSQGGDTTNTYGPYGFPSGDWWCKFYKSGYYNKTETFSTDADKIVDVVMEKKESLTIQEHDWLRAIYECVIDGDCDLYDMLQNVTETTTKIWNQYKRTDQSVIVNELITNSVLNSTHNISIEYNITIPNKEGYSTGDFLPVRLSYWFVDQTNSTCYNQDKDTGANRAETPYCIPLVTYTGGKIGDTINFTVQLRPNLPTGTYYFIRNLEIDPDNIWINYGQEMVGKIDVLSSGEARIHLRQPNNYVEDVEQISTEEISTVPDTITEPQTTKKPTTGLFGLLNQINLSLGISLITLLLVVYMLRTRKIY